MTRRAEIAARLPVVFGLRIAEAAAAVGISEGKFRHLQERGLMPRARDVDGVPVVDVDELALAFKSLPHAGEPAWPAGDAPAGRLDAKAEFRL